MGNEEKIIFFVFGILVLFFLYLVIYSFGVGSFSFGTYLEEGITGEATSDTTSLSIAIGNNAPVLSAIGSLFVCEDSSLSQSINATDANVEDTLDFNFQDPLTASPFFLDPFVSQDNSSGSVVATSRIFTGTLSNGQVGSYSRTIVVDDGTNSDSEAVSITVIEINDAPVMTSIANQNLDLSSSSLFYYQVNVTDEEDGNQAGGSLSFNISFTSGSDLFNISSTGLMNYTSSSSDIGDYTILVCVTDLGISDPHANILAECGQTGGNRSDCDSFNLEISETPSVPVNDSGSSGGGGGGGGATCDFSWGCYDWDTCQMVDVGLESGDVAGDDYRDILEACSEAGWVGDRCGYQNRDCVDVNECGSEAGKPDDLKVCFYTENPTCSDGIENCHDGACEFLIDCGGPCGPCPTCSDGIKNQGEEGVDCDGPCPNSCESLLAPLEELGIDTYLLVLALLLVVGISAIIFRFFIRMRVG